MRAGVSGLDLVEVFEEFAEGLARLDRPKRRINTPELNQLVVCSALGDASTVEDMDQVRMPNR